MAIPLRQSTASQEVPIGYFVDSTDGNTEETGLTIANTDVKIWKAGATTLANKNSGGATHISNGIYYLVLDATDTNTLGPLVAFVHVSGALPVRLECVVLAANVYDALIAASDALQVDAIQLSGTTQTARDIGASVLLSPGTGTGQISLTSGAVTAGTVSDKTGYSLTATTGLGNQTANITGNLSGSVGSVTGAVGSVTGNVGGNVTGSVGSISGVTFPTNFGDLSITVTTGLVDITQTAADKAWSTTTRVLTANTNLNDPTAAAIADAVWDEAQAGHVGAGTFGEVATEVAAIKTVTDALPDSGALTSIATASALATVDSNVDAILVDTGTTLAAQIAALNDPTAAAIADAVWDEVQSGHIAAGSFGELATEIAAISVDTDTTIPALIAALNDLSAAQVNAEVVDALATDTYAEPGQGAPSATATLAAKIGYLYKAWRNKTEQTATTLSLYDDSGTTVDQKATVSDDGTTATKGEVGTGP